MKRKSIPRIFRVFWPVFLAVIFSPLLFLRAGQAEEKDGAPQKKNSFLILPIISYTPETRWAGGVGGLYTFHPKGADPQGRPSALTFVAIYTQNHQYTVSLKPELYLNKETFFLAGNIAVTRFPDKFFGIGNATPDSLEEGYTPHQISFEAALWKKIVPAGPLYAGLVYSYDHYRFTEFDPAGQLATGSIPGSGGGSHSGFGLLFKWDDRDNVFAPTKGRQFSFSASLYNSLFGSDYNYALFKVDLRSYVPINGAQVLAVQGVLQTTAGTTPFAALPKLGGDSIMRGYYGGRYRDRALAAIQAEYRLPVWWRFGLVAFAGLGDVAANIGRLKPSSFKYSVGWGIRFKVNPQEGANIRLDFGYGKGVSGMYFTAGESF